MVLTGLLAAGSLHALTCVHVSDLGLTEQADVIARVEVIESQVVTPGRSITTEHTLLVRELIKGDVDGAYVTVRVPGGYSEELGVELHYNGTLVER